VCVCVCVCVCMLSSCGLTEQQILILLSNGYICAVSRQYSDNILGTLCCKCTYIHTHTHTHTCTHTYMHTHTRTHAHTHTQHVHTTHTSQRLTHVFVRIQTAQCGRTSLFRSLYPYEQLSLPRQYEASKDTIDCKHDIHTCMHSKQHTAPSTQ